MTTWRAPDLVLPEVRDSRSLLAAVRPWLVHELGFRPPGVKPAEAVLEQLAVTCVHLARRHPRGPATLQVFDDDKGNLCVRVVMSRPQVWPPKGAPPSMLKAHARKRAEAVLAKGPPKPKPWASGTLVLMPAPTKDTP